MHQNDRAVIACCKGFSMSMCHLWCRFALLALLVARILVHPAHAQCGAWDNRFSLANGLNQSANIVAWDPDGAGPRPERLFASGVPGLARFSPTASVIEWTGRDWVEFAQPRNATSPVSATLRVVDDDDPQTPAELFIMGSFTTVDGIPARGIARRVGNTWVALGNGMPSVNNLIRWDPDGSGPAPAELVVGGMFTVDNNITYNRVARWNGTTWSPMSAGFTNDSNASVNRLFLFDFDAQGPEAPRLIAAGRFFNSGTTTVNSIASWNGDRWEPIGNGFRTSSSSVPASVSAITDWDFDGPGPLPAQLIVGGDMTLSGTTPLVGFARWTGSEWIAGPSPPSDRIGSFAKVDLDGPGPAGLTLFAGQFEASTSFGTRILRLAGSSWTTAVGLNCGSLPGCAISVTDWDHDGSALTPRRIVGAGLFLGESPSGQSRTRLLLWDGTSATTSAFGYGLATGAVAPFSFAVGRSVTAMDVDGPGPATPTIFTTGNFLRGGTGPQAYAVAQFKDGDWLPAAPFPNSGQQSSITLSTQWDRDGDGPLLPVLLTAFPGSGSAGSLGTVTIHTPGNYSLLMSVDANGFLTWDTDGSGPDPTDLFIAAGRFNSATGEVWQYRTSPTRLGGVFNAPVLAVGLWDADSAGPVPTRLVAGGRFTSVAGVPMNGLAMWDGSAWQPIGEGITTPSPQPEPPFIGALLTHDFDGPGPNGAELVVAGAFTRAGLTPVKNLAAWNGQTWRDVGGGFTRITNLGYQTTRLTTVDLDGPGPRAEALVVTGPITTFGTTPGNTIAVFENQAWTPLIGNISFTPEVHDTETWDPDGPGPLHPLLVVSGAVSAATPFRTDAVAIWNTHAPQFTQQPGNMTVNGGQVIRLVAGVDCPQPVSFTWTRDGVPLTNGFTPAGSLVEGADFRILQISNATALERGTYVLTAASACGLSTSQAVTVNVTICDSIDFNNNTVFPEEQDVIDFFSVLAGGPCSSGNACSDIDFNNNGVFPEEQDVIDFFDVLAGAQC